MTRLGGARMVPVERMVAKAESLVLSARHPLISDASREALVDEALTALSVASDQLSVATAVLDEVVGDFVCGREHRTDALRSLAAVLELLSEAHEEVAV